MSLVVSPFTPFTGDGPGIGLVGPKSDYLLGLKSEYERAIQIQRYYEYLCLLFGTCIYRSTHDVENNMLELYL